MGHLSLFCGLAQKSAQGLAQRIQNTHNWKPTRRLPLARSSYGAVNPYINLSQSVTVVKRITAEMICGQGGAPNTNNQAPPLPPPKKQPTTITYVIKFQMQQRDGGAYEVKTRCFTHTHHTHTHITSHPTLYKSRTCIYAARWSYGMQEKKTSKFQLTHSRTRINPRGNLSTWNVPTEASCGEDTQGIDNSILNSITN